MASVSMGNNRVKQPEFEQVGLWHLSRWEIIGLNSQNSSRWAYGICLDGNNSPWTLYHTTRARKGLNTPPVHYGAVKTIHYTNK